MKKRKKILEYLYIYSTKNILNEKCYVGQHASNDKDNKYLGSGILIDKAIKKYGRKNFIKTIIEFCNNEEELNEREIYWIKQLNTIHPYGYNISEGGYGNGTRGVVPWNKGKHGIYSKETIEKMTKKLKLINVKGCKGHPCSEEAKLKIGAANKINSAGEKNGMFGKHHTEETLQKMRDHVFTDEHKKHMSESQKGKKLSEETKIKLKRREKCIYCGAEMNISNLNKYHNKHCKYKNKGEK